MRTRWPRKDRHIGTAEGTKAQIWAFRGVDGTDLTICEPVASGAGPPHEPDDQRDMDGEDREYHWDPYSPADSPIP
jgi:hypothetical protein